MLTIANKVSLKSALCLSPTKSFSVYHFESYVDIRSLFLLLLLFNSKMTQVVTILLMMLLGHITSGQQYPDCIYTCQNGECIVFLIIV